MLSERIKHKLSVKGVSSGALELAVKQSFSFYDIKGTGYLTFKGFIGAIERMGVWLDLGVTFDGVRWVTQNDSLF